MSYKIAVASSDGKVVNQHFGRADKFYIVEVLDDQSFAYRETREFGAVCAGGEHDENTLEKTASALSDCRYVLVSQIGPGAEYALSKQDITVFSISHFIDEAVKKIIHYNSQVKVKKD